MSSGALECDVIIVGSGPVGATYARVIHERRPASRIVMIEAGPQVTDPAGRNIRNLADEGERDRARTRSQGDAETGAGGRGVPGGRMVEGTITARQGTHLLGNSTGMPAAAVSTCVGGQGAHWTGATPAPRDSERIPFLDDTEWVRLIGQASRLLNVNPALFPRTALGDALVERLAHVFAGDLASGRGVGALPVAAASTEAGSVEWTGVDTILGDVAASASFELRSETLATRVLRDGDRVRGVDVVNLQTGDAYEISASVVVIAADALRTPQLLWASGIRPAALGRYLTEHPLIFSMVRLDADLVPDSAAGSAGPATETPQAMFAVPFSEPRHPFAGQIMCVRQPPIPVADDVLANSPHGFAMVGWGCRKSPRPEDAVVFSEDLDAHGLPAMSIIYELTDRELAEIKQAEGELVRAAEAIGQFIPGGEPRLMPNGTSLHYQGTFRMGATRDGTSVCDRDSRVWNFANLYLGGNGLIPTATVCNPTLTSVALAVRGAEHVLAHFERPPHSC